MSAAQFPLHATYFRLQTLRGSQLSQKTLLLHFGKKNNNNSFSLAGFGCRQPYRCCSDWKHLGLCRILWYCFGHHLPQRFAGPSKRGCLYIASVCVESPRWRDPSVLLVGLWGWWGREQFCNSPVSLKWCWQHHCKWQYPWRRIARNSHWYQTFRALLWEADSKSFSSCLRFFFLFYHYCNRMPQTSWPKTIYTNY